MNPQILDELKDRLARLEATIASPHRRRFHNQTQCAEQLNMSVSKLRQERRAGRINGVLRGRVWYFTDEEIENYLRPRADEDTAA